MIATDALGGLGARQSNTELLLYRPRDEAAHAVLPPVRRLHHLFDAGSLWAAEQRLEASIARFRTLVSNA